MKPVINKTLVQKIVNEISDLEVKYQENQGLILSESDLKCLIFKRVSELLPEAVSTSDDDVTGSPLHTEIPFYDENGKLRLFPDIAILDPKQMSIKHALCVRFMNGKIAYGRLPSKGFHFKGKAIVVEIKFYKSKCGIRPRNVKTIKADVEKIFRLQQLNRTHGGNNIFGIIVIFNKTNKCHNSFHGFLERHKKITALRVIYGTGNVRFKN